MLASGTLQPFELVDVGSQVSGQVKSLKVALGDKVLKGQIIANIDPAIQRNALLTAQATLEQQKAQRLSQEPIVAQDKLALARQSTAVCLFPPLRNFGVDLVMRMSNDLLIGD